MLPGFRQFDFGWYGFDAMVGSWWLGGYGFPADDVHRLTAGGVRQCVALHSLLPLPQFVQLPFARLAPAVVFGQILLGARDDGGRLPAVPCGEFGQFGLQFGDAALALLVLLLALLHQVAEGLRQPVGGLVVHMSRFASYGWCDCAGRLSRHNHTYCGERGVVIVQAAVRTASRSRR